MEHVCFHAISDHNSEFLGSQDDLRSVIQKWKKDGEEHIRIYKITTEEMDSDFINLAEKQIGLDEININ